MPNIFVAPRERVLITGGTGFIGSNLVASWSAEGARIAVSDVLDSEERRGNLAHHTVEERFDPEELTDFLTSHGHEVGLVVHMGAISSTTVTDVDLLTRTNVTLSQQLWAWCAEHGVPFLYASSAAVYGDGADGFSDRDDPAYLERLRPLNPYGASKLAFDRWVLGQIETGRPTPPAWYGLRFFNVYGPNEYHKGPMRSMVTKSFPGAAEGRPVTLFRSHDPRYGDGEQERDFVYVDDCVSVVRWLLAHRPVSGHYNVGTGRAQSWLALMSALYSAVGRELAVEWVDTPQAIRGQYQYHTQADVTKLRAAGYHAPFLPVEEGVRRYVSDYLTADDRYR